MTLEEIYTFRERMRAMSPRKRRTVLERMGKAAAYDWPGCVARDSQVLPLGDWLLWVICAGRGFGKTRTGAETVRWWVEYNAARNFALVGPTAQQCRDVLIEGESGLLSVFPSLPFPSQTDV